MRRQSDLAIGERVEDSRDHIREACHRASDRNRPRSRRRPRPRSAASTAQRNSMPDPEMRMGPMGHMRLMRPISPMSPIKPVAP